MPRLNLDPDILPQDLFDELGVILGARYDDIELEILKLSNKYAKKIIDLQSDDPEAAMTAEERHQAQQIRLEALKEIRRTAEEAVHRIRQENLADELIKTAAEHGTAFVARNLPEQFLKSINPFPATNVHAITAMQIDLRNRLEVLNQRILRYPQDLYQKIIAETAPLNLAGVLSSREAQKKAVAKFLATSVDGFRDKSGRNWRIGSYAEMAGRTATQRAWNDAGVARMNRLDINTVTAIVGYAGCEYCSKYGGRVLSTDGTPAGQYQLRSMSSDEYVAVDIVATLDEARTQGFQHPNCRCTVVAFIPGVTVVPKSTYDPEAEKESRQHRELERDIREAKRKAALAVTHQDEIDLRKEISHKQATLRDFLKDTGRDRSSYREQLHFADGGRGNTRGYGTQGSRYISKASFEYATTRTPATGVEKLTKEQWRHILTGDDRGGGHRFGASRPDKTEFPKSWDDKTIYDNLQRLLSNEADIIISKSRKSEQRFLEVDGITIYARLQKSGETMFIKTYHPKNR